LNFLRPVSGEPAEAQLRQRNGRADILNRRRIQQQIGELCGVGQRALEVAIDPVELPHDPCGGRKVAEREEDGLQTRRGVETDVQRDS